MTHPYYHRLMYRAGLSAALSLLLSGTAQADDWPMWRADPGRSATSAEQLPAELHLRWVRMLPPLKPA